MAKNVQDVVMGMLSTAGSSTRPPQETTPELAAPRRRSAALDTGASGADGGSPPVAPAPAPPPPPAQSGDVAEVPRTLRLRPKTASLLREAWVQAKHEDVFLTAQDFASNLLEEALMSRRRRRSTRTA
ncbi:hypothetical protein [Mycobacterium intracellulare]|uniref:hypothetical protein n=1 Tax=Mycobacterium intracellulare TaxID=1767 RepID=UPI00128F76D6|nr:hypothetical protein [Mycobacterium intracellulare]